MEICSRWFLKRSLYPYRIYEEKGGFAAGGFDFLCSPYRFYEEWGGFVADGFVSFSVPVSLLRGNSLVCGFVAIASLLRR